VSGKLFVNYGVKIVVSFALQTCLLMTLV